MNKEESRYQSYLFNVQMFRNNYHKEQERMDKDIRIINMSGLGLLITFVGYMTTKNLCFNFDFLILTSLLLICFSLIWSLFLTFFSIKLSYDAMELERKMYDNIKTKYNKIDYKNNYKYNKFITYSNYAVFGATACSLISFMIFITVNV